MNNTNKYNFPLENHNINDKVNNHDEINVHLNSQGTFEQNREDVNL